jgi:hypothetical protein
MSKTAAFLVCVALVVGVSSPATAATSSDQSESHVKIRIAVLSFNCPAFAGHLRYDLRSDGPEITSHVVATKSNNSSYSLTLSVVPGHYQLLLDAEIPGKDDPTSHSYLCETQQWFTAIPDHDRHLALILGSTFTPHSECSIAGSLPVEGLSIDLVLPKGHLITGTTVGGQLGSAANDIYYSPTIDGSAYYFEHVAVEAYVLRFGGFGGIDIPMDLTKLRDINMPYCTGEFVHNITQDELRRAFPPSFGTE